MSLDAGFQTIEFIGPPGSGKTFHNKKAKKYLNKKGKTSYNIRNAVQASLINKKLRNNEASVRSIGRLAWYYHKISCNNVENYYKFSTNNRELTELVINNSLDRTGSESQINRSLMRFFLLFSNYQTLIKRNYEGLILPDQGFCHRGYRAFCSYDEVRETVIDKYVDLVPKPDLLFCMKAEQEDIIKRIEQRPSGYTKRMQSLDENQKRKFITNMEKYTDKVISRMKSHDVEVVEIQNKYNSDSIDKIKQNLNSLETR